MTSTNTVAMVDARKDSPDWQVAQSIASGLRLGQMHLNPAKATELAPGMTPEHKAVALDLIDRWVALDRDANALVARINAEILEGIKA
jgi:hypothetical protein